MQSSMGGRGDVTKVWLGGGRDWSGNGIKAGLREKGKNYSFPFPYRVRAGQAASSSKRERRGRCVGTGACSGRVTSNFPRFPFDPLTFYALVA